MPDADPATTSKITEAPCVGMIGDEIAFAVLLPSHLRHCATTDLVLRLEEITTDLPVREAGGTLVRFPWDLVHHNGEQIIADWRMSVPGPSGEAKGLSLIGPASFLVIDPSARIEPYVIADTTNGPVVIGAGAVVTAFTRLEGPCVLSAGTQVHGAKIRAGTTLGPQCRIGGEVEASIVQGYSNKYHDGFLGHAYLGEWVNLGAGTQNSDLRNDYGLVRVVVNGQMRATGQSKVGCFIGDHTKSGLGTLLNTGTSAGVFSGLLPSGGLLPKYVPSFTSWWNGSLIETGDLDSLLHTAETVMARRGQTLSAVRRALYAHLFEQTGAERRKTVREAEAKRLRRTA